MYNEVHIYTQTNKTGKKLALARVRKIFTKKIDLQWVLERLVN
jgi:hypothetical protein